jgi:fibronectin-binding autotransporter adhesin
MKTLKWDLRFPLLILPLLVPVRFSAAAIIDTTPGVTLNFDDPANEYTGNGTLTVGNDGSGLIELATASGTGVTTFNMTGGLIDILGGVTLRNGGWQTGVWTSNLSSLNVAGTLDVWDGNTIHVDALSGGGLITKTQGSANLDVRVGVNGGSGDFSGVLKANTNGGWTLVKVGSGTQTLSGTADNDAARATVNAGTLVLAKASSASVHALGAGLTIAGGTAQLGGTGGDQIYDNVVVAVDSGLFDLNGLSETIKGLTGTGGTVGNASGTQSVLTINHSTISNSGVREFGGAVNGNTRVVLTNSATKNTDVQTFSGTNGYTGGTLIDNGHLRVTSDAGLGAVPGAFDAANITLQNGGVLQNNDSDPILHANRGVTLGTGGGVIYTGWNKTVTVNGVITGSGGLTKADVGTLTLAAANTYAGNTAISAGTLDVGGSGTLGGGTYAGTISNSGTLAVSTSANQTLSGMVSGTGALVKSGAGTLTLSSRNNPYTGATTAGGGTLALSGTTLRSAVNVTPGSTLSVTGGPGLVGQYNAWTGSGAGNFNTVSALNNRFSSLTPALQYNGSTDASGNFDFASNGSKFPAPYNVSTTFEARWVGTYTAPTDGSYTFFTASDDGSMLWIDGQLVVNNNFAQGVTERSGAITLTAGVHDIVYAYYNSGGGYGFYSNVTTPGGSKALVNNSALSSGAAIGTLTGDAASTLNLADTTNLTINQAADGTFAGLVTGAGGLFKTGTALLTLSNEANGYTGKTIFGGGLVSVAKLADAGSASGIGAGSADVLLGRRPALHTGAGDSSNRSAALTGNGTIEVTNAAAVLNLTGAASSLDANSTLLKTGPGTLTLGGSGDNPGLRASANAGTLLLDKASGAAVHAINGALTVAGGTARLAGTGGDQIADGIGVTVNSGSLDLNARNETIKFLAGSGGSVGNTGATQSVLTLALGASGTQTYSGAINDNVRVVVTSSTTKNTDAEAFTGTNGYTGGTLIDNGHLRITSDAALGAVPGAFDAQNITIQNGGVLQNNDSSPTLDPKRGIYLGTGGGVIYSGWSGNNRTFTIPGAISGPGALTRDDGAILVLSGGAANTFAGNLIIRNGTTVLAKPDGVSAIGAGNLASGSAGNTSHVQWSANEQIPDSSIIDFGTSGHMHLSLLGRTETVAGINATAGLGVIQNRQAEANVNNSGTFVVNGAGASTFNGYIRDNAGGSGAGLLSLVKNGAGTLTLSGVNITHTGGTTVNDGKLILGGGAANGTIRGTLTVNGPGVVEYAGANSFGYNGGASVNVLNINGGTVGNAGFNNHFYNSFQLNLTGGTLNLGGDNNEFSNPTVTVLPSAVMSQIVAVDGTAVMRLRDSTSGTFNVADGAAAVDLEVNAPIIHQNAVSGITKTGAGTLRLSGANTYGGLTRLLGGTLALNNVNALQGSTLDTGASGSQQVTFALPGANTYNIGGLQGADALDLGGNLIMIGSNNASTTYAGAISGAGGALTKGGTGTFNLTGAASYTGATTVTAGRLNFASTLGGDLVANAGTTISAGTGVGGAATFSGVTYLNSNGPLAIPGALTLTGTNTINLKAPAPGTSTVTLMTYGGALTGDSTNLALANAATYRGTPVISAAAGVVQITGLDLKNLTWTGAVNGNWDVLTTANWTDGAAQQFATGDAVTFDDGAAVKTVVLPTTLVAPSSITFNNSAGNNYVIQGNAAGRGFTGATGIVKNGAGTVEIQGFGHNYTGAVTINAGILQPNGNYEILGNASGVTINSGGQFNINGMNLGNAQRWYSFTIAGDGANGLGAITNTHATGPGSNAGIRHLTLSGNASVGGNGGRFDLGLANGFAQGTITGNGFTLTKVGGNVVNMRAPATGITYVVNAGTLKFEDSDAATGSNAIAINGGTLQSYGTRTFANALNFAAGTTLDNDGGGTQTWSGPVSLGGTAADQVNVSARSGGINLSGVISGAAKLVSTGGNTLTLTGVNTYTGATTINAGTLVLGGANGSILDSPSVTLGAGTTLRLDNLHTANNGDRLGDGAGVTLNGATFNFSHNGIATNFSETAGALSINAGGNTVQASQAVAGQTSALTFASLSRTAGAKVNFSGTGLGVDTRNRILFTSAPALDNGILGTWALINNSGWATYDAALGVRELSTYTDVTRLTGNKVIADGATSNVRIIEGTGGAASITLGSAVTTINTLLQSTSGGATAATLDLAGNTLRLGAAGGILSATGSGALTIGTGATPGVLTAGGADNTAGLVTLINNGGNNVTVNAVISDNGSGAVTVRKEGTGNLVYAGTTANTHTGATILDSGNLYLNKTGVAAISGSVQMGAGNTSQPNLRMQQSNQFAPGVVMSFANLSGNWARFDLAGTNQTLAGLNAGNVATQAGAIVQNKGLDNVSTGNSILTLDGGGDYTYNGYIRDQDSGTGVTLALVKAGAGTQTLAGTQILYTGGTTVNGGALVLASANVGRGAMTVNTGGTLRLTAGNAIDSLGAITLNAGGTMTDTVAAHNIVQPFTLNGGTLSATVAGNATFGNFVLGNNVTVGGTSTSVVSADLRMGANATRDFNVAVTGDPSGVDLDIRGYFSHLHGSTWGFMSKSGPGTMRFASTSDGNIGRITVNAGRVLFEDAINTMGNGGLLTNVDGISEFKMNTGVTKTFSGTIGGTGLLRKTGDGTMVFSGTLIDQTGTTAVQAGTLRFLDLDDLHAAALPISSGATAEFQTTARNFARFTNTVISGDGVFAKSGAGLLTTGNSSGYARWNLTGGTIDVRQGEFRADYQDANAVLAWGANKASLNVESGAFVSMVGGNHISVDALTGAGTVQNINNWGTGVLTVGQNNGSGEFTGVLRDNGGPLALTKTGSGTQILSGVNTYTGATQINQGTLIVNGTHNAAGLINVAAGATLGGSGSVGTVTVADDAILSPGNSAGHLIVNNLTLNQNSVLNLELSAPDDQYNPASDFVTVQGNVDLWGVINIAPLAGFGTPNDGDRWLIMTYGGGLADYGATIGSAPGGADKYFIDTSEVGSVYINVVPEAGTATLLIAGALFLLRLRAARKG